MKKIGVELIIIGFPLLGALLFLWNGISIWQDTHASPNWPSVNGRVIDSEIRVREIKRRKDLDYPFISYRFTVDQIEYQSSQIKTKTEVMNRDEIEKKLNLYPKGKQVRVYYDPKNPSNAVLEPGGDPLRAASRDLIIGTLALIFAMIMAMAFVWESRTSDDKTAIETNQP